MMHKPREVAIVRNETRGEKTKNSTFEESSPGFAQIDALINLTFARQKPADNIIQRPQPLTLYGGL